MNPTNPNYKEWLRDQAALAVLRNFSFDAEDVKKLQEGHLPDHKLAIRTAIDAADVFVRELELRDKQQKRYQFQHIP